MHSFRGCSLVMGGGGAAGAGRDGGEGQGQKSSYGS